MNFILKQQKYFNLCLKKYSFTNRIINSNVRTISSFYNQCKYHSSKSIDGHKGNKNINEKQHDIRRTTLPDLKNSPVIGIWKGMNVKDLSKVTNRSVDDIEEAMILSDIDHLYNTDAIIKVCNALNFRCKIISQPRESPSKSLNPIDEFDKLQSLIVPKIGTNFILRPPVVTIMGHVDHGKTTILDALRKSEIVKNEHGGITQHIGAFVVALDQIENSSKTIKKRKSLIDSDNKNLVTFLDTPGHAAFHTMRQRGANVTDIVVLVIAVDDGILDQTVESINFAQKANVPIVVAINKVDKVDPKDPSHLKRIGEQLNVHGIEIEAFGGETQAVLVSGLANIGLNDLKESIIALAEAKDIRAPLDGDMTGYVIESSLDPARGRLATILVKTGTLKKGDYVIAYSDSSYCYAKVRSMFDEFGNVIDKVPPGFPIQIIGWKDNAIPEAGDTVVQVSSEKIAKDYVSGRKRLEQVEKAQQDVAAAAKRDKVLTELYKDHLKQKSESDAKLAKFRHLRISKDFLKVLNDGNEEKKLNLIIKADVHGSVEAILDVLETYPNETEPLKMNIVHYGVGPITDSELELASLFPNTFVYTFNLPPNMSTATKLRRAGVPFKPFNVIYHMIDDIIDRIGELMPVVDRQEIQGELTVVQEFMIGVKNKKVPVAGSRCVRGNIKKGPEYLFKIERNGYEMMSEVPIISLRYEKDEVEVISKGSDCGLRLDILAGKVSPDYLKFDPNFDPLSFHFLPGDKLISYCYKKVKLKNNWLPKGFKKV